jgi:hypothetical protein
MPHPFFNVPPQMSETLRTLPSCDGMLHFKVWVISEANKEGRTDYYTVKLPEAIVRQGVVAKTIVLNRLLYRVRPYWI